MATHKFAVGQAVYFSPDRHQEHTKGSSSRSFAYSPKLGTRSSIVSKAKRTASSASFGKTSSPGHEKIEIPTVILKITHAPTAH
jgi:hypothetical protein